jgi:hypothetical protein
MSFKSFMQGLKSSPALKKAGHDSLSAVEAAGSTFFSSLENAIDTSSAQGLVEATILHGVVGVITKAEGK